MPNSTHILIVEDNQIDQFLIRDAIQSLHANIDLVFANDGAEAIELLETADEPSLIVTDLKMPRINGIEFLNKVKTSDQRRIPVIMFTTSDSPDDIDAAYYNYVNAYIVKPLTSLSYKEVAKTIHKHWLEAVKLPVKH